MKKVTGLLFVAPVLIYFAFKLSWFFFPEHGDERVLGVVAALEHQADGLWILIKARGRISESDYEGMHDSWGRQIRAAYQDGALKVTSAGSDGEFDTKDDITVEREIK